MKVFLKTYSVPQWKNIGLMDSDYDEEDPDD